MTASPQIVLFSVHKDAMAAAVRAFAQDWPEARISNLLEDGLFEWVRETGGVVPEMHAAFHSLTDYMIARGADAILYTCSAFGECIDACIAEHDIPMLKPNDAMIEKALDCGSRIAVVATVAATIPTIAYEFEEMAAKREQDVSLVPYVVDGAFDAMASGNGAKHDLLVAETAEAIEGCDAIALAQFTLSRAAPAVEMVTDIPVLHSPGAAVAKLRELLGA